MGISLGMSRRKIKRKAQKPKTKPSGSASKKIERQDVSVEELKSIIEKSKSVLSEEEVKKLEGAIDTLTVVTNELELKGTTVRRLRRLLFGASSEKLSAVLHRRWFLNENCRWFV